MESREYEIKRVASDIYITSEYILANLGAHDLAHAFEHGAKWADSTNIFQLFKKLPHLDNEYNKVNDWGYSPNLYHFDGSWHISWIHCEDGDSLIDFEYKEIEEAIKAALEWCKSLDLIWY